MKYQLSFFSMVVSFIVFAQSAPAYYANIDFNQEGDALKQQLNNLITNTHTHYTSYSELKTLFRTSDVDPGNSNHILLIYGSENSGKHQRSRSYDGSWNREHVFPKSKGTPNLGTTGPGADGHHLRPADYALNSDRNNFSFDDGTGDKAYKTSRGGWYPGNEWKGDVARILMYMYVRYQNRAKPLNATFGPATYSSDFPDILLKWNVEDPVSYFESHRNNVVANSQHNRNPFIDNPYLATVIWGGPAAENKWPNTIGGDYGDTAAPSVPQNLHLVEVTTNSITLEWDNSTDDESVAGYDIYIDGTWHKTVNTNQTIIYGLSPATNYVITIKAYDHGGNKSAFSEPLSVTTTNNGTGNQTSCGIEDFENIISTGSNPTASTYTTRTWTNHGITWEATNARTDLSIDGNSKAICIKKGHLKSSTIAGGIGSLQIKTQLQYSGNSGHYILKINGIEKGLIPYSADVHTYTVNDINVEGNFNIEIIDEQSSNRVAFDDVSWTCYDNLNSNNSFIDTNTVAIYPNPVTDYTFNIKGLDKEEALEIYNDNGQLVQRIAHVQNHQPIHLNALPHGVYFVKTSAKTIKILVK